MEKDNITEKEIKVEEEITTSKVLPKVETKVEDSPVSELNKMFAEVSQEIRQEQEAKITVSKTELKNMVRSMIQAQNHIKVREEVLPTKKVDNSPKVQDSKQAALNAILALQKKG